MSTLARVDAQVAAIWWDTLNAHRPVGEELRCPICGTRKCWPRAEAFGQLVATDEWHKGPPPDIDRPHQTAGGARRMA